MKKKGDEAKVAIRNIRRDANEAFKKMNKNNELTEDDQKDLESQAQKMTDKYISDIDKAVEEKTGRLLLGNMRRAVNHGSSCPTAA